MPREGRLPGWKEEVIKMAAMMIASLIALWLIMSYPTLPVVVLCVLSIGGVAWYADRASKPKNSVPLRDKAVFITGCDTGFGHKLALSLDEQGVEVFAGCLRAQGEGATLLRNNSSPRLHVVQCDVTSVEQIEQASQYVRENLKDKVLWGVVNNAGVNADGDIELVPVKYFELANNVNYMGMVRVTKQFLPLIRQSRGRFVNMTSVKGRLPTPFCGAYTATKYAGEAFSDILRQEMRRFGVTVSVIEPGRFGGATPMMDMTRLRGEYGEAWETLPEEAKHVYGESYIDAHLRRLEGAAKTSCFDLHLVTDAMEHALFDLKPRYRYLIPGGPGYFDSLTLLSQLKPFLPDWLMDLILVRPTQSLPKPNLSPFLSDPKSTA